MGFLKNNSENENRKRLRKILNKLKIQSCPEDWEYEQFSVGGLTEIGFSENKPNLLLAISSNGRGVFDCSTLKRTERDPNDNFEIDYSRLTCSGIGMLKDEKIRIAGLHGGGLSLSNFEGESLELMALDWPKSDLIFQAKWASVYDERDFEKCLRIYSTETLMSYGFSPDGNFFVIATSSDLLIFKKKLNG